MANSTTMDLGTELTIPKVGELYVEALRLLTEESEIKVDLSDLQVVDTAGVQFLLALSEAAELAGHPLKVSSHSSALNDAIATLGLKSQLAQFMHSNN